MSDNCNSDTSSSYRNGVLCVSPDKDTAMDGYKACGVLLQGTVMFLVISGSIATVVNPTGCPDACSCNIQTAEIDCSNQRLTDVPDTLPSLGLVLKLSSNSITVIRSSVFTNSKNLKIIYFENNIVADIEVNAFRNLYQLERLLLSGNRLTDIQSHYFHHLVALQVLDLRDNQLQHIASDAFTLLPRISNVNLHGNSLVCNCSTVILYQSLQLGIIEGAFCSNYNGRSLSAVADQLRGTCSRVDDVADGIDQTSDAPATSGGEQFMCPACSGAASMAACRQQPAVEYCTPQKMACRVELLRRADSGRLSISSSCESPGMCAIRMGENSEKCEAGIDPSTCQLCCTTKDCVGEQLLRGFAIKQEYILRMDLLLEWNSEYTNANSLTTKALANRVISQINAVLEDRPRSDYVLEQENSFTEANPYGVKMELKMSCTLPSKTSVAWYRDEIYFLIRGAMATEGFNFGIDVKTFTMTGNNFCSSIIPRETPKGLISFPSQLPSNIASAPCPDNPEKLAYWPCNAGLIVNWGDMNVSQCETPTDRTTDLEDLSREPVKNDTIIPISIGLVNNTRDNSNFTHREVSLVTDTIQNCLTAPTIPLETEAADNLISSINKMLSVDSDMLVKAELSTNATTRLVQAVERIGGRVELLTDTVTIAQSQLALVVTQRTQGKGLLFEATGNVMDDLTDRRFRVRPNGQSLPDLSGNVAAVNLPSSALDRGRINTNVHFAVYNAASFFKATEIANISTPENITQDPKRQFELNSRVVSAKVGLTELRDLTDPVTVTLRHLAKNSSKHRCVYWDFSISGWSDLGCKTTSATDESTTCQCDHLTNFALLLDIYGTAGKLPEIHKTILSFISYIGCAISAGGLILTLLTYFGFRKMLRDNPSKILVNLCVALLGIIVAFIFTTQWFVRDNTIACKFFAALTHYFVLASMAWMSVEAFYMYVAIVRVFHTYYSKFMLKCCLIGWGIPLVAIAITVGINRDNYGRQGEICWLARIPFFAAVLAPVSLSLILNCVAFGLVIHQLRLMDTRKLEKSKHSNIVVRLRGAISIMVLLGLTWIFAFFAIGGASIVFHYLFAICNSLQGLFIFVFYCLMKKDAQVAWLNCMGCETSSNSPSTSRGRGNRSQTVSNQSTSTGTQMTTLPPGTPDVSLVSEDCKTPTKPSQSATNRL